MNVILHGAQARAADWDQVKALLEPAEVPERRGRGGVPLPAGYGLRTEIDDLHAVLDRHERPTLIGHSYGGLIALLTAQERDDLEALVLYEPAIGLDETVVKRFEEAVHRGDRDLALEIMVSELAGEPVFRDTDPERWLQAQDLLDTTVHELKAVMGYRYEPPKLSIPVTVVVGEHTDRLFGPAARDVVRDTGGKLVTVEGAGHIAHVTHPEVLAEIFATAR
ncbi:alpha/beta hydrolase [Lentzea sp. BCCO 10_0798]|uniref:Alpha/beta hydrolase n=1 Tax=Lentzea kristufekii TaxID=3095430 RepID=A0ABU4U2D2_9PSEU|nr:alpha/beta hydrolase [Lentzea sp. BCCO 10_0798]MDX8054724.1 alpha/beta hydrolase [Lentzea sp. BCCO 10_0798]